MSSSRKRSAVNKAQNETENVKQKLMLVKFEYKCVKHLADLLEISCNEKKLEVYELKLKYCPDVLSDKDHSEYKILKDKTVSLKQTEDLN